MFASLKSLDVSYKKTLKQPKVEAEKYATFSQKLKKYTDKAHPIIFLDEIDLSITCPQPWLFLSRWAFWQGKIGTPKVWYYWAPFSSRSVFFKQLHSQ